MTDMNANGEASRAERRDTDLVKRMGNLLDKDVFHTSGFDSDVRELRLLAMRLKDDLFAERARSNELATIIDNAPHDNRKGNLCGVIYECGCWKSAAAPTAP